MMHQGRAEKNSGQQMQWEADRNAAAGANEAAAGAKEAAAGANPEAAEARQKAGYPFGEPTKQVGGFFVRPGFFSLPGAHPLGKDAVSFTISSHGATSCTLLLYAPDAQEPYAQLPFPASCRLGDTFSMIVYGLRIEDFTYAYRMDGPYDPKAGLLFDEKSLLLDPYARSVVSSKVWGERPAGCGDFVYRARVVDSSFDWGDLPQKDLPFEDLIIYELHVRGFTRDASSGVEERGTYEGLRKKIPYLVDLGVNAVELMPIFAFDERENARVIDGVQLYNYWGYSTVNFFSPNAAYTFSDEENHEGDELKHLIKDCKAAGIEVILDVVFNHTAEGGEGGPCFSFKGIDNNLYYMLTPDGSYYNFSGCGNTINANHPMVRRFILDCLRYWVTAYRVDGFRFDLASILGRGTDTEPMPHAPLLEEIAHDPILSHTKLIAEAWDAAGMYEVGSFSYGDRFAEWNGRYRDDMRSFLKGDAGMASIALRRLTGSRDIYDTQEREVWASVNFLTCHDGFTLYDLYSYNKKHNEANGWGNGDGDNFCNSWNCGEEGKTKDPAVEGLRRQLVKNAFAALLISRGVPMFLAGDEFCNTQFGNNNAYCQDSIVSWLDWSRLDDYQEIHDFVRFLIRFRKNHPILRKNTREADCLLPPISIHNGYPNNGSADRDTYLVGVMFAGRNAKDTDDDIIFYCMNAYWEPQSLQLPQPPAGRWWHVLINTALYYEDGKDFHAQTDFVGENMIRLPARAAVILLALR